ncbi:MAG: hypothetical protein KatS3mg082_0700 [Nitrospiraceae bacterium]|nr:MAG: hypothetical protein KatS3mg082_0700 [Nitrospiraceae bacterium]
MNPSQYFPYARKSQDKDDRQTSPRDEASQASRGKENIRCDAIGAGWDGQSKDTHSG